MLLSGAMCFKTNITVIIVTILWLACYNAITENKSCITEIFICYLYYTSSTVIYCMWATWQVQHIGQDLFTLLEHPRSTSVLVRFVLLSHLITMLWFVNSCFMSFDSFQILCNQNPMIRTWYLNLPKFITTFEIHKI